MQVAQEKRGRVLVVDDETGSRAPVSEFLRELGYEVRVAADGFKALGRMEDWDPDLLLTDLKMPGMDGVTLFKKARDRVADLAVIVMTAFATVESAVDAMHEGADDYLTKPMHLADLELRIDRVLGHRALVREAARMRQLLDEGGQGPASSAMIGESRVFREVVDLARQVAPSNVPIAITGPEGSGKRLLAQSIHGWGERSEKPFVVFDCAGALEEAAEAAVAEALVRADDGTVCFLGIDKLPDAGQARLLEHLESGGPSGPRMVVTATPELRPAIDDGRLRQDLAYRVGVVTLRLPALRERQGDIPLLAAHFARQHADLHNRARIAPAERTAGILLAYSWPGNVRQLHACMERAVVAARGREIEPRDLPRELLATEDEEDTIPPIPGSTLDELERYAILKTLEHTGGSTSKAARMLGISVRKVQYRLSEWGGDEPSPES